MRATSPTCLQALTLLIEQQLMNDVERYETLVDLHVIPPLCPLAVSAADFSHGRYMIDRAYVASAEWLAKDSPMHGQRRLLDFHHHSSVPVGTTRVTNRRAPERGRAR
jgi:NTE family protein